MTCGAQPVLADLVRLIDCHDRSNRARGQQRTYAVTFTEAASELGVCLSTIQRMIANGAIPVVSLDTVKVRTPGKRSKRIRRADLAAYVDSLAPSS